MILKNTSFLTAQRIFNKLAYIPIVYAITQILGPTGLGQYNLVMTIFFIVSISSFFGLDIYYVRELSRNPKKSKDSLFTAKLILNSIGILALLILTFFYPEIFLSLIFLSITLLFGIYSDSTILILRAKQQMKYESISLIIRDSITLSGAIIGLYFIQNINVVFASITLSSMLNAAVLYIFTKNTFRFNMFGLKNVFKKSQYFFYATILLVLAYRLNNIVLEHHHGTEALGIYALATMIIMSLDIVPNMLGLSAFPEFSSKTKKKYVHYWLILLSYGIIAAICMNLLAHIITTIFGVEFQSTEQLLRIASFFVPLYFINSLNSYIVYSKNGEKFNILTYALALFFVLFFGNKLIINFGEVGAVYSFIGAFSIIFTMQQTYILKQTIS